MLDYFKINDNSFYSWANYLCFIKVAVSFTIYYNENKFWFIWKVRVWQKIINVHIFDYNIKLKLNNYFNFQQLSNSFHLTLWIILCYNFFVFYAYQNMKKDTLWSIIFYFHHQVSYKLYKILYKFIINVCRSSWIGKYLNCIN